MTGCLTSGVSFLRMLAGWAFVCLWVVSNGAGAAPVTVVMSDDAAPYQEVYLAIRSQLEEAGHEVHRMYADGLSAGSLNDARLVVVVGVRAAELVSALPGRSTVLAVLVPRAWFHKYGRARLLDSGRRVVSAVYLDQPFERQARLIRMAFPDARRVGVLLSADQKGVAEELDEALRMQRLGLVHQAVMEDERLLTPLELVLNESDVLLAVPDPLVFNRSTAQSLFLTSYRYRDPVVGYSRSMTRAGALVSLYSTPAQIGRQAAEWIVGALNGGMPRLPAPGYPAYFEVSINDQVARSLGFTLPSEAELERRLGSVR